MLRLEALRKSYNVGLPTELEVLHGIDLTLKLQSAYPIYREERQLINLIGTIEPGNGGRRWRVSLAGMNR